MRAFHESENVATGEVKRSLAGGRIARAILASILAFCCVCSRSVSAAAVPQSGASSGDGISEAADALQFLDLIEELRSHIDRSQFDLEALLESLNYDADRIIEFVRAEVAFEQYPGLLRGARGTLRSRAGNALDQSVLLATLLKDAGYEARVHRGRLSNEQAVELLAQMAPPRPYPPAANFEAMERVLWGDREPVPLADSLQSEGGWEPPPRVEIDRAVEFLRSALEAEGVALGDPRAIRNLREEARDYFWVEMRLGVAEWESVHPVFAEAGHALETVATAEIYGDQIPTKLQHRLRFEAFIEQKIGDELKIHPTMEPWERPVANLTDRSFALVNVPWGLDEEAVAESWPWREAFVEAPLILPLFATGRAPGARAFDRNGVPFSVEALGMDAFGATALVKEVSDKFEQAAGAMSGLGRTTSDLPPEDLMALTAQWVEYTQIAPGGDETRHRRVIFDRLGAAARARGDTSQLGPGNEYRGLVAHHTFRVATGRIPPAMLVDETLAELGRLLASATAVPSEGEATNGSPVFAAPEPFLFSVFDQLGIADDQIAYRSGPAIVARQSGLTPEDSVYFYGDIVQSPWRSFESRDGAPPRPSPDGVMRQGVWETATEEYLLALAGFDEDGLRRASSRKPVESIVLYSDDDELTEIPFGADTLALIRRDLEQGRAVLVSGDQRLRRLNPVSAWWRIDPDSGQTLGVGSEGRGAITLEWIMKTTLIAVILAAPIDCYALACEEWSKCSEAPDPQCCKERFSFERRRELQSGYAGTLMVKFMDAVTALAGVKAYSPRCLAPL